MFCFQAIPYTVPLFCKTDHIPAVFSKNGVHFSILQFGGIGMGRSNVVRICFGVDRFHIVVCQHDVLSQTASFELTQIAGNLHILIQTLVDCKMVSASFSSSQMQTESRYGASPYVLLS